MDINKFRKCFYFLLTVYFIIQVLLVLFSDLEYQSDSLGYYENALAAVRAGSMYPADEHLYSDYITAPLFTNLLVIILSVWDNYLSIALLNILFIWLQIYLIYLIARRLFDEKAAIIAAVLFMFYLNNLGLILLNMTEPLFNVLLLASFYFYLRSTNLSLLLSGIFASAAIAVRPIGTALLASLLIILLYNNLKFRRQKKPIFYFTGGAIMFLLLFGSAIYLSFGRFIVTSTNGPVNLLIGANDDATGAYNNKVFNKGNDGYIEEADRKTYIEKQRYWGEQAYRWITENPFEWISLIPMKLGHIFLWDDYAISVLVRNDWNLHRTLKLIISGEDIDGLMPGSSTGDKYLFLTLQIIHHGYYYFLLIVFIAYVFRSFKKKQVSENETILFLFILLGLLINLLSFGDPRFKYPYIVLMIIIISPLISGWTRFKKSQKVIL